jgi:hypothetical protein
MPVREIRASWDVSLLKNSMMMYTERNIETLEE